jgi:predicted P-loop ATPase
MDRTLFDCMVEIAEAPTRLSKKWRNKICRWSELVSRCENTTRTAESMAEYARLSREEQSNIKDVGGFVGGYLSDGIRKTRNVKYRTLVTLDIDYGTADIWEDFTLNFDCAAMLYSTHKHTPQKPRLRLVLPASRKMTPQEYEPVCRYWTARIGIELFDHTTYQLARLFYWPSTSRDGEYYFRCQDGRPFDVDEVLASYRNPYDVSEWAMSSREGEAVVHEMRKAGDPTGKPGIIGAFCRAYSIEDVIAKYLPNVYEKTATDGRYTYTKGSVAGGCVTYDGKYAYSHHETDPAGGRLCNAFDLVRIHLFGIQDEGKKVEDVTKLPSYARMREFAAADKNVTTLLTKERLASAEGDFADIAVNDEEGASEDDAWMANIDYDKKGQIKASPKTLRTIMLNDRNFKMVRFDLFSQRDVIVNPSCPFIGTHGVDEVDDTSLARMCAYLSEMYSIDMSINNMVDKMLKMTAPERAFHAVKDFITKEQWDGVPRVDTLLIDYLGAKDSPIIRDVTRKWMAGAVGRAIDTDPDDGEGIKFDYCLVLYGEQGTGKSTFAETLANRWRGAISFADAKKEQYETLQRSWIVEIPEFKGMKTADTDAVKDLISSRSDNFRAAYARQWNKNPRHSIMIGSTNNEHFLKDVSGNRRFWVVKVDGGVGVRRWRDKLKANVGQIWAEAYAIYKAGEPLMLSEERDAEMRAYAENFNEIMGDPLRDYLDEWLAIPLPVDWGTYEQKRRTDYFRNYDSLEANGTIVREQVAIYEIITTCPYPGISKYSPQRIGCILKSLGWQKIEGRKRGGPHGWPDRGPDGKKLRYTFYEKLQSVSEDEL